MLYTAPEVRGRRYDAGMARWRTLVPGWNWATLEAVALPALTTLLGLQLLRLLLNGLVFYLRDSLGAPTTTAGVYALLLFMTAFLAAPLGMRS